MYIMYMKNIAFLTIFLLFFGCGRDAQDAYYTGSPTVPLKAEFYLSPDASNITNIQINVSSPDMETQSIEISDIDAEQRTARGTIQLPVGIKVSFYAKAFEGDCPVLKGSAEDIEVLPADNAPVIIQLGPVQFIISLRSNQTQMSIEDNYSLEVYLEDASRLAAFTCQLEFDEDLLKPLEIVPGEFFGKESDFLFIEDSQLPGRQRDMVAMGITRKMGTGGVCGSGVLFRVTFQAISPGPATVKLLENEMLKLKTETFGDIEDPSSIRVMPGIYVLIE